jgi:hypothetical protein
VIIPVRKYGQNRESVLRPAGDSVSYLTWRGQAWHDRFDRIHAYPTQGCHGAPLERECSGQGRSESGFHWFSCDGGCNGTGRIRLDAPNRRDVP